MPSTTPAASPGDPSASPPPDPGCDFDDLVARCLTGARDAWAILVHRLERAAWSSINQFDLSEEDRNDVFASTFLQLYQHLRSIRQPARLPGWVVTTARNEACTLLRLRRRVDCVAHFDGFAAVEDAVDTDRLIGEELGTVLGRAMKRLPERWQALLALLTTDPPLPYDEIADRLQIPPGSIGPTRQRCIARLRNDPELRPYLIALAS